MKVCLVRHAIAVERGTGGYQDDRARPLTAEGRKRMAETARGLRTIFRPEEVHTSPVLRARQTAGILAKAWEAPVLEMDALGRGDHTATLAAAAQRRAGAIALVGHEPWLSELFSLLTTADSELVHVEFKKGAAALLEGEPAAGPGQFQLLWFLPPAVLRELGR